MPRVFISYRRTDSVTITGRIYDHLMRAFGDENVFKDVDDIPLGADFRATLDREVSGCDVLLAVVGQTWVSTLDPAGARRLENPDDFVRIEIAAGLRRDHVLVVPVLVNGAAMPSSIDLPPDLQELAYRNAAIIRDDPDFRRDMERLIAKIKEFAAQAVPSEAVAQAKETAVSAAPPEAEPAIVTQTPPTPSPAIPRAKASYQTAPLGPAPAEPAMPTRSGGFLPGPRLTALAGLLVVAIIAAVALILASQGGTGQVGADPLTGSDPATARLTCGGTYHGTISDAVTAQTWQMPAEGQGEWVLLTMNADPNSELDAYLILRDPEGSVVNEDDDTGQGHSARMDVQLWTPGTWTVQAQAYEDASTGGYELKVTCDFQPIDCNSEEYGTLSADNPTDLWLVYADTGQRITISMRHAGTNPDGTYLDPLVALFDSSDTLLAANDDVTNQAIDAETYFDVDDDGLYLIEAKRSEDTTGWGEYYLDVTCGPPDQSQQQQSQEPQ